MHARCCPQSAVPAIYPSYNLPADNRGIYSESKFNSAFPQGLKKREVEATGGPPTVKPVPPAPPLPTTPFARGDSKVYEVPTKKMVLQGWAKQAKVFGPKYQTGGSYRCRDIRDCQKYIGARYVPRDCKGVTMAQIQKCKTGGAISEKRKRERAEFAKGLDNAFLAPFHKEFYQPQRGSGGAAKKTKLSNHWRRGCRTNNLIYCQRYPKAQHCGRVTTKHITKCRQRGSGSYHGDWRPSWNFAD